MSGNGLWSQPARATRKRPATGIKRAQPERGLQIRVAVMLSWMLPGEVPWTAIGHGGGGEQRGRILKRMGVQAGWPDIHFVWKGRACYCELKASGGALSPAQKMVHESIMRAGGIVRVCKSEEEVVDFLTILGVPMQARLSPADRASRNVLSRPEV